jgi:hypothetical protein
MESDYPLNLIAHRSDVDVWSRRSRATDEGVGQWLVSMAGATLVAYGTYCAISRSWRGLWWIASGVSLLGCAAAGFGQANGGKARWSQDSDDAPADVVTRESLDSFPASDAPSSNATTTTPRPL